MTTMRTTYRISMEIPEGTDRYDAEKYAVGFREWLDASKKWNVKVEEIGYIEVRQ